MKEHSIPVRVICNAFSIARATLYRFLASQIREDPLVERITQLSYELPEYGYRRIWALLKKEGIVVNQKKVYRIYTQLSLQKEVKRSRKIRSRAPVCLTQPQFTAHVWSADFVDVMVRNRKIRLLFVIDDHTRLIVGSLVDLSIPAYRVQAVLQEAFALYSRPRVLRTDNGPEFREGALNRFLSNSRVKHEFIVPGKPQQNGFSEAFNARLNNECLQTLDMNLLSLKEFQRAIQDWVNQYNYQRPHSSLQYEVPIRYHIASY